MLLRSTHNLCFGPKIRKLCVPLHTQFYYVKVRFTGVFIARTCFPDEKAAVQHPSSNHLSPLTRHLIFLKVFLPLNIGTILQIAMGLRLENCPYTVSMKNRGTPHRHRKITYGMKNAPGKEMDDKSEKCRT